MDKEVSKYFQNLGESESEHAYILKHQEEYISLIMKIRFLKKSLLLLREINCMDSII